MCGRFIIRNYVSDQSGVDELGVVQKCMLRATAT